MPDNDDTDAGGILSGLNIPEVLAGPAGKALSRLVAGFTDIPAAYLQRKAQQIKDGTDARSVVNRAVAKQVAKQAAQDSAIIDRAMESLVAKEYHKQKNKESIATKTAELLNSAPEESEPKTPPEDVNPDWMNVFEQHAENASSERLQDIWARVLAGEIRKPKSFSAKTLGFIAELDQEVAQTFEKFSNAIIDGVFIPKPEELSGNLLADFLLLEDFGIITGTLGFISQNVSLGPNGRTLFYRTHALHLTGTAGITVHVPAVLLTRVGTEVVSILSPVDELIRANEFISVCPKENLEKIAYGRLVNNKAQLAESVTLWEKPKP